MVQAETSKKTPVTDHVRSDSMVRGNTSTSTPKVPSEPPSITAQKNFEPPGHDTCTTTDEEDAVEALLSLGLIPDTITTTEVQNDNDELMPIGRTSTVVDANPVEIK